jgi:hypothetical protein
MPPKLMSREEFFAYVAQLDEIPVLYDDVTELYCKDGLRGIQSGLLPPDVAVWVWPDKLCLFSKPLFAEIKAALAAMNG